MANPEHLEILRRGVEVWNRWRAENPEAEVDLREADLKKADLRWADLRWVHLRWADLARADLREAHLTGSDLSSAKLRRANLTEANLTGAYLRRADLRGVNLTRADLSGANLGETSFGNTTLTETRGLDACQHDAPSNLDHRTLANNPNLPEAFLRGCGLSDADIEYAKLYRTNLSESQITDITYRIHELRSAGAISYHTCFISYSSKNEDFARKLHDDLQDSGVRCWFAPEDLKIGAKIRPSIDRAVHMQDKLLLILSETSVKSQWVEQEVETALEKERDEDRVVLCPIRIDDAVMKEKAGWAAYLKKTRNIGDFTNWKDDDAYQEAFKRLLRDLKAD